MGAMLRLYRLCVFAFSLITLAVLVGVLGALPFATSKKLALTVTQRWSRFILKVMGIRVVHNSFQEEVEEVPRVMVANHVSYLDIPVLLSLGPRLFLAKKEVANWPMMGAIGKSLGMLYVDRDSLRSRAQAIRDIRAEVENGKSVLVFPEGTTSESGPQKGRVPYFAGAFRVARELGVPVELIYLDYSHVEKCAWVGEQSFVDHLWKFLGNTGVTVRVRRDFVKHLESRHKQREVYFSSRNWFLEGGHSLVSSLSKKPYPFFALLCAVFFSGGARAESTETMNTAYKVDTSFLLTSGNTQLNSWSVDAGVERKNDRFNWGAKAFYLRSSDRGQLNAQQRSARVNVGRSLNDAWKVETSALYFNDVFRGLENQYALDVSILRHLLQSKNYAWTAALSLGYLAEDRSDATELRDLKMGFHNELRMALTKDLSLNFAIDLSSRMQEIEDWRLNSTLGFATPIHPLVKFKAEWVTESMNRPPLGKVKTDYRTQFGLTAEF